MLLPLAARRMEDPVGRMGLTSVTVRLTNPADRRRSAEEALLVDSGAIYAVVPGKVLRRIGVRPHGRETFTLADGSQVQREVGTVFFEIGPRRGGGAVIFGERGDAGLLGALTLETLGLMLDPLKRELRPLRMTLA
jgi:predicted aspartyl protease